MADLAGYPIARTWLDKRVHQSYEVIEVFRIDSYVVGAMREMKVTRLVDLFSDDDEVGPFLAEMSQLVDDERGE